ncbi:hypothetical protein BCR44DRAFT_1460527 [Catenaria anguillulae PL171]|uniref:Uncharacterized protein n=1 Tax=Catenaria anguillulae PL171 TaxID=765915 RepID=A0A1Y2HNG1_9FUNG|nr:hypothetical protein BCR44DRAFT_1460527 [Catenaria anguillulae PL171]
MDNFAHVRKTFDNESAASMAIIRLSSSALNLVAPTLRIFSRLPSACGPMCTTLAIGLLCTTLRDVIGLSTIGGPASPDAGVHLIATIANLALIDAARGPLHALQVVPILISRIRQVSQRKIAFIEHLAALSNLCCFETSFLRDVVACNGHLAIQQALARYPTEVFDREVLLHGLHITAAVSRLSSEHDKQFLTFAFDKLRERLWDTPLQGAGLSTLGNLYANTMVSLKPIYLEFRQEIMDALPMLVAATNRFRWHESLQTTALFMFSVLSCDAPLRKHLLSQNVPHVIFRACMTDFETRTVDSDFVRYISNKDACPGSDAFVRSVRGSREACRLCDNGQACDCELEDDEREDGIGLDTGVNSDLDDFQGSGGVGGSAEDDGDHDQAGGDAPPQTRGEAFAQMRRRAVRGANGITTKDSGMTMEDIRALYLGPSLMLLGEKVQDQRVLISMGALQALYHGIQQSKRQRVTLMLHFVLQRLIKSLSMSNSLTLFALMLS